MYNVCIMYNICIMYWVGFTEFAYQRLQNSHTMISRPRLEYCVQFCNPVACHGNWSIMLELKSIQ